MKRFAALILCLLAVGCGPTGGGGYSPQPDSRGEAVTDSPYYQGKKANAPIPAEMHKRNEGSAIDGGGMCVTATLVTNGRYQGVGPQVEKLWIATKQVPGGSYPQKLDQMIRSTVPELKFAQYEGTDPTPLKRWSAAGYPVGVTYGTGALYGYQPIAHMVSLSHLDDRWAAIIDNNNPGKWSWMPAQEFARRWTMTGGQGWAVLLQYAPEQAAIGLIAATVGAACLLLAAVCRRRFA